MITVYHNVGDVIKTEDGQYYVVNDFGFRDIIVEREHV